MNGPLIKFFKDLLNCREIKLEEQINPRNELVQWMRKLTFQHKARDEKVALNTYAVQAVELRWLSRMDGSSSSLTEDVHGSILKKCREKQFSFSSHFFFFFLCQRGKTSALGSSVHMAFIPRSSCTLIYLLSDILWCDTLQWKEACILRAFTQCTRIYVSSFCSDAGHTQQKTLFLLHTKVYLFFYLEMHVYREEFDSLALICFLAELDDKINTTLRAIEIGGVQFSLPSRENWK